MKQLPLIACVGVLVVGVAAGAFSNEPEKAAGAAAKFPAPRTPELVEAKSVAEALPYARELANNKSSFLGRGLGVLKAGEKAILIPSEEISRQPHADIYIQALVQALKERDVTAIVMRDYEIVGVTKEEALAIDAAKRKAGLDSSAERAWSSFEGCGVYADMGYLKKVRPDLFALCNPPELGSQLPDNLKAAYAKMRRAVMTIPGKINAIMDEDPSIRGVFYGRGGPIWMLFPPHQERWIAPMVLDNKFDVMAPAAKFPADVWMLAEETAIEPFASVDKVTVTDPEGTNVWWTLTEQQARSWAKGAYLRGHLFMFPQEAYGQYAMSVVNYPSIDPEYIPVDDSVLINGTIAGTASDFGFFPRMVETWKDNYLVDVQGGGLYGDMLRTLMKQPDINTTVWPQRKRPGFFQFYETALATNPKAVRPSLDQPLSPERVRDGVIHWALGAIYLNDPGSGGISSFSGKLAEFSRKTGLPGGHGFHIHTFFNTLKLHLRGSNKWVTMVDRGRSTALDSPEVRALASRYGDPDKVLATEWIPQIPGINAPGSYLKDFAQKPYEYSKMLEDRAANGGNRAGPSGR